MPTHPEKIPCFYSPSPPVASEDIEFWRRLTVWLEKYGGIDPVKGLYISSSAEAKSWGHAEACIKTQEGEHLAFTCGVLSAQSNPTEEFFRSVASSRWATEGYLVLSGECSGHQRRSLRSLSREFGVGVVIINSPFDHRSFFMLSPSTQKAFQDNKTIEVKKIAHQDLNFLSFLADQLEAVEHLERDLPEDQLPPRNADFTLDKKQEDTSSEFDVDPSEYIPPMVDLPLLLAPLLTGQSKIEEISLSEIAHAFDANLGEDTISLHGFLSTLESKGVGFEPDIRGWGVWCSDFSIGTCFLADFSLDGLRKIMEEPTAAAWILTFARQTHAHDALQPSAVSDVQNAISKVFSCLTVVTRRIVEQIAQISQNNKNRALAEVYLHGRVGAMSQSKRLRLRSKISEVWYFMPETNRVSAEELDFALNVYLPLSSKLSSFDKIEKAPKASIVQAANQKSAVRQKDESQQSSKDFPALLSSASPAFDGFAPKPVSVLQPVQTATLATDPSPSVASEPVVLESFEDFASWIGHVRSTSPTWKDRFRVLRKTADLSAHVLFFWEQGRHADIQPTQKIISQIALAMGVPTPVAIFLDESQNQNSTSSPLPQTPAGIIDQDPFEEEVALADFSPEELLHSILALSSPKERSTIDENWLDDYARLRDAMPNEMISALNEFVLNNDLCDEVVVVMDDDGGVKYIDWDNLLHIQTKLADKK